jgi:hypothetical protein
MTKHKYLSKVACKTKTHIFCHIEHVFWQSRALVSRPEIPDYRAVCIFRWVVIVQRPCGQIILNSPRICDFWPRNQGPGVPQYTFDVTNINVFICFANEVGKTFIFVTSSVLCGTSGP